MNHSAYPEITFSVSNRSSLFIIKIPLVKSLKGILKKNLLILLIAKLVKDLMNTLSSPPPRTYLDKTAIS